MFGNLRSLKLESVLTAGLALLVLGFYLGPDYKRHSQVYYALIGLPFLLFGVRDVVPMLRASRLFRAVVVFCLYVAASAFWSVGEPLKREYKSLFYALYLISLFWAVSKGRVLEWLSCRLGCWCLAGAAVLSVSCSVVDQYWLQGLLLNVRLHNSLSIENINDFSQALGWLCILLLLVVRQAMGTPERVLAALVFVICLAGCVLTQSKSTLIGIMFTGCAMIGLNQAISWRYKAGCLAIICLLVLMVAASESTITERFKVLLNIENMPRYEIYRSTLVDLWSSGYFLFGRGLFADTFGVTGGYEHPHSIYLSTLYGSGLMGLLVLLGIFFMAARSFWFSSNDGVQRGACFLLLYGALVLIFDGSNLLDHVNINWLLIWVPCAVLVAREIKNSRDLPTVVDESQLGVRHGT